MQVSLKREHGGKHYLKQSRDKRSKERGRALVESSLLIGDLDIT